MNKKKNRPGHELCKASGPGGLDEIRNESYQSCAQQSSINLKEKIGSLLLHLQSPLSQDEQKKCWALFESSLSQYPDLKVCGGMV